MVNLFLLWIPNHARELKKKNMIFLSTWLDGWFIYLHCKANWLYCFSTSTFCLSCYYYFCVGLLHQKHGWIIHWVLMYSFSHLNLILKYFRQGFPWWKWVPLKWTLLVGRLRNLRAGVSPLEYLGYIRSWLVHLKP